MEIRIKGAAWPPTQPISATVTASGAPRGSNPLQDSFARLEQAEQLRLQGKLDRAQKICDSLLREYPGYAAAFHTLGLIYADKKNHQLALNCFVRAVMLNPRSWPTLILLGGMYLELGATEMAARTLEQARAINPSEPGMLVMLGDIYSDKHEYELAGDAYAQALKIAPQFVPAAAGLGCVQSYLGKDVEAVATFETLIKQGAATLEVFLALANLPASLVSIDLLAEVEKFARSSGRLDAETENMIAFARASALDRAGRHQQSWEQVVAANRTAHLKMQGDLRALNQRQQGILAALRARPVTAASSSGSDKHPISLFILGPSRSGKSTMESLVATLDGVKRGYENPGVELAVRRTFQTAGLLASELFELMPPQLYPPCRESYLEDLVLRAGAAKVVTNTGPARIYDAALVASVFPDVRFIFMKRDIEDTVLRMFQCRYRAGNYYAYDLKTAREFVAWYHQMIDLLATKLPNIVRIVRYEDMVADPAGALRIAADLCGLPMHDRPVPPIGDDRGCAEPYRQFMAAGAAS